MLSELQRSFSLRANRTAHYGYLLFGLVLVLYVVQFRLTQEGGRQGHMARTKECLEQLNELTAQLDEPKQTLPTPPEPEPQNALEHSLLPGWASAGISSSFIWSISKIALSHILDDPWNQAIFSEGMEGYDNGVAPSNIIDKNEKEVHKEQSLKSNQKRSIDKTEQENAAIERRDSLKIRGESPLIFIHIPKTAGTTVSKYLEDNWERYEGCTGILHRHRNLAASVVESMRNESSGKCLYTIVWHQSVPVTRLRHWVLEEGVDFRYEHGHHPIGLCMYFARGCHYTTVLREPIERSVSHYYYLRTLPENFAPFVRQLNEELNTMDKFLDAVETNKFSHYGLFNMHTLMLAGDNAWNFATDYNLCNLNLHGCDVRPDSLTWAHVQFAKRNLLTQFPVIGLTDRLLEYGVLMKLRYRYPYASFLCGKENANTQQHRNDTLTETQLTRIRKINKFDIALYDFAVRLHEAQIRHAGQKFVDEMKKAQKYCQDVRNKKAALAHHAQKYTYTQSSKNVTTEKKINTETQKQNNSSIQV